MKIADPYGTFPSATKKQAQIDKPFRGEEARENAVLLTGPGVKKRVSCFGRLEDAYAVILCFVIMANMASAAMVELITSVLLRPCFPRFWYKVRFLCIRWAWIVPIALLQLANIRIMVSGAADLAGDRTEGVSGPCKVFRTEATCFLAIANHLSWADSFVLSAWLASRNAANGDTCWVIWKWFLAVPLGWVTWLGGYPFLGFGKAADIRSIARSARNFFARGFTKYFVFPEGGILRSELLQKSQAYAVTNNLPRLEHCLLPKTAALVVAGRDLQKQGMQNLVDITIAYTAECAWAVNPYELLDLVKRHKEPVRVYLRIERHGMDEIEWANEDKVRDWLNECWVRKDQNLRLFHQGKGPLVECANEEAPAWTQISEDIVIWLLLQVAVYWSLGALCCFASSEGRRLFLR